MGPPCEPAAEARVASALRHGAVVLVPTDTVYGLCVDARQPEAVRALYELKGREARQPIAILAATVADLLVALPGLPEGQRRVLEALLPGPYTFVVSDPTLEFEHLGGGTGTIGVRVPQLTARVTELVQAVGLVGATSANHPGDAPARKVDEVPEALRAKLGAILDEGELPGTPSTVIDLTTSPPAVLRSGAVPGEVALAAVLAAWPR